MKMIKAIKTRRSHTLTCLIAAAAILLSGCAAPFSSGKGEGSPAPGGTGAAEEESSELQRGEASAEAAENGENFPASAKEAEEMSRGAGSEKGATEPSPGTSVSFRAEVTGPFGQISASLPEGWEYMPYTADSAEGGFGDYGMLLRPAGSSGGHIDLCFMQNFGVCGTGLQEETVSLAGDEARIGTYDEHEMWDFVSFAGVNKGVVAQSISTESWSSADRERAMDILDSLKLDPQAAAGGTGYFQRDSEIPEIGLIAEARNITGKGAVINFRVWDPELAAGQLEYGEDYSMEKLAADEWIPLEPIIDGWAVNDVAHLIPADPESGGSDWKMAWDWLYGELEPGRYRIIKPVVDFRGTGDYVKYDVRVYFIYAGEKSGEEAADGVWISPAAGKGSGSGAGEGAREPSPGLGGESAREPSPGSPVVIAPEGESQNSTFADMDPETFLFGDAHWEWWSASRDAANRSAELSGGTEEFCAELMRELLISDSGENSVCSPLNVYLALAMLAETADGSTREQILRTLRAESPEALRERAGALWAANSADTPVLTSKLANSLWLRNDIGYNEDTLHRLANDYFAASFRGVMGSPEMNAALQSWTDEHTGGLLSDYVSGLSLQEQTVLALISTIYYKAAWTEKFSESETRREAFHGTAGDAEAEMMHSTQGMGIYRREKFSAISLDLNDSGEMFFFLPEEGVTPEEIIADPALFNVLHRGDGLNIPYALVRMTIPKFTVRERTDLREKLEALGITDALSAETADFSLLTDEAEGVFLSRAEHAAMVEIDEEGVTGAAYTALMLDGAAAIQPEPVDFVLDRPFCFVVTGLDGSILFAGIVNNIE